MRVLIKIYIKQPLTRRSFGRKLRCASFAPHSLVVSRRMSMNWDLAKLREHIDRVYGCDSVQRSFLDSIDRYILIQVYHRNQATDAMKGIVHEGDGSIFANTRFVLGVAENQQDYAFAKIANEANLIALIYATRATYDIFSQLVNSLVLNDQFSIERCNIGKVGDALPESSLKAELKRVRELSWYRWLMDFVNTVKHRQLVKHSFAVNMQKSGAGIFIESFEYKKRKHPKCSDSEIIGGVIELAKGIVPCGHALNNILCP